MSDERERQYRLGRAKAAHGYGHTHVKHSAKAGEMRECDTSGCMVKFTPAPECPSCRKPTIPLQD